MIESAASWVGLTFIAGPGIGAGADAACLAPATLLRGVKFTPIRRVNLGTALKIAGLAASELAGLAGTSSGLAGLAGTSSGAATGRDIMGQDQR